MVDPDLQAQTHDIGSGWFKCGFTGDDAPRAVFPTIIGRPKNPGIMIGMDAKDCFVGDEAQAKRGILKLKYPIQKGIIRDWNDFKKIMTHSFYNELCTTPEDHPLFLTEVSWNPRIKREITVEIIFEIFNNPAMYLCPQSICSLYCSGRTTGHCLLFGEETISSISIYEGVIIPHTLSVLEIGGKEMTNYMTKILGERGYEMTTSAEREIVIDIKEKLCYVADEFESELTKAEISAHCEHEYELPDGSMINTGDERFRTPEIMFKPSFIGLEDPGIHEMCFNSIQRTDIDLRKDMYQNIVLSGGPSMYEGLCERLMMELQLLAPIKTKIKVNSPAERKYAPWIGGSILSSLSSFRKSWITKDDYDDFGRYIVNRKCPNYHCFRNSQNSRLSNDALNWSFKNHSLFSEDFQELVIFLIWTNNQKKSKFYKIPIEVWYIVLSYLGSIILYSEDKELFKKGLELWKRTYEFSTSGKNPITHL